MGLFNKKNELNQEMLKLMERFVEAVEQKNELKETPSTESIVNTVENNKDASKEAEKKKVAYALNLCLISVSQIIDYNDLYVLEQEYESILNNINIEKMPKDEALLEILRQILDTITFFRIQEGEKYFIEQDYRNQIKNAIWKAVPNFGVIISGSQGNPWAALGMVATQVGIGYMNYRKAKAEINAKHERNEWDLQKSAIEQFNGLRRELFTTAWRLADEYKYKDEYRLTENQIKQYNQILMDTNPYRRYERLKDIEVNFEAYPPYWYLRGHAALEADEDKKAKDDFKTFFDVKEKIPSLLRCDEIVSACALEYIGLLDKDTDKNEIKESLEKAVTNAGVKNDIIQLCAIAYMKNEFQDEAAALLRKLVREEYNEGINVQLLSSIYISQYLSSQEQNDDKKMKHFEEEYKTLTKYVDKDVLLPWPDKNKKQEDQIEEFDNNRKEHLINKYAYLISEYFMDKSEIYNNLRKSNPDERSIVMFFKEMENELEEFPCVKGIHGAFNNAVSTIKNDIEEAVNKRNRELPDFFGIFNENFVNEIEIDFSEIINSQEISKLEDEIEKIALNYIDSKTKYVYDANEYTLSSYLASDNDKTKGRRDEIQEIIKKRKDKLIKEESKNIEILLNGDIKFKRYVKDHKLSESDTVAIINDTSLKDNDLIFETFGVRVHEKKSIKHKLFNSFTATDSAIRIIQKRLLGKQYFSFYTSEEPLSKLKYNDKRIDIIELENMIEEIKKQTNKSSHPVHQLYAKVLDEEKKRGKRETCKHIANDKHI